jgi:hypothetical protein
VHAAPLSHSAPQPPCLSVSAGLESPAGRLFHQRSRLAPACRHPAPQLKTWVERGKEAEARAAATLAPPPIPSRANSSADLAAAADSSDATGCVGSTAVPCGRFHGVGTSAELCFSGNERC